eukprot:310974-Amorphochlora_amoeboformis.AAC.2
MTPSSDKFAQHSIGSTALGSQCPWLPAVSANGYARNACEKPLILKIQEKVGWIKENLGSNGFQGTFTTKDASNRRCSKSGVTEKSVSDKAFSFVIRTRAQARVQKKYAKENVEWDVNNTDRSNRGKPFHYKVWGRWGFDVENIKACVPIQSGPLQPCDL